MGGHPTISPILPACRMVSHSFGTSLPMGIHEMGIRRVIGGWHRPSAWYTVGPAGIQTALSLYLASITATARPPTRHTRSDECRSLPAHPGVLILGLQATAEAFERALPVSPDEFSKTFERRSTRKPSMWSLARFLLERPSGRMSSAKAKGIVIAGVEPRRSPHRQEGSGRDITHVASRPTHSARRARTFAPIPSRHEKPRACGLDDLVLAMSARKSVVADEQRHGDPNRCRSWSSVQVGSPQDRLILQFSIALERLLLEGPAPPERRCLGKGSTRSVRLFGGQPARGSKMPGRAPPRSHSKRAMVSFGSPDHDPTDTDYADLLTCPDSQRSGAEWCGDTTPMATKRFDEPLPARPSRVDRPSFR